MATHLRIEPEPVVVSSVAAATVVAAIAPMLAEPHVSSGQVSQQLSGHVVSIVEDQGDWLLVRGADDYEGWVHRGYLRRDASVNDQQAGRLSLGCQVVSPAGTTRSLPLRAVLAPDERVEAGESIEANEKLERFPTDARAICRSAVELFIGTSYQWGGVTPWGADCSGLVQSVFALHGVQLARDAWQQARAGRDAGRDLFAARLGDLLFFSDRQDAHITHVAIALGEHRLVHLALGRGGYAVEQLDDEGNEYVGKLIARFLFARTVL
jgi:gamma-D-glutamyl-L-lysine dipeptidyl-peptidase